MDGLLMKVGEVKARLNVSRKTVYRLAEQKEIHAVQVGGQRMYERRSVERWVEERIGGRG